MGPHNAVQAATFTEIVNEFEKQNPIVCMAPDVILYHGFAQVPSPFYALLHDVLSLFAKRWSAITEHYQDKAVAIHMVGMQNFGLPLQAKTSGHPVKHHFCISLHFKRVNRQGECITYQDLSGYTKDLYSIAIDCTEGCVVYPEAVLARVMNKNKSGKYLDSDIIGKLETSTLNLCWYKILDSGTFANFLQKFALPETYEKPLTAEDSKMESAPQQSVTPSVSPPFLIAARSAEPTHPAQANQP